MADARRGRQRSKAVAMLATAGLHALVATWLLQQRPASAPSPGSALQVVWIERPPPALPAPPPAPARRRAAAPGRSSARSAAAPAAAADDVAGVTDGPDDGARRPADATALARQAEAWARTQPLDADFLPDPMRRGDPPSADGPFAMRDPLSPADVVRAIGTLVGGAGYATAPCPRIRQNIADLGSGGDRALLEEELRRLRRLCL